MGSQGHNCGQRRRQRTKARAFSKPNRETRRSGKPPCVRGTHRAPGSQGSLEPEHIDGKFQSGSRVSQSKAAAPPGPDLPQRQVRLERQREQGRALLCRKRCLLPSLLFFGEGNGSPLPWGGDPLQEGMAAHSSVLPGEPQGRGAWWAAVWGVAQSRTRLSDLAVAAPSFALSLSQHQRLFQ